MSEALTQSTGGFHYFMGGHEKGGPLPGRLGIDQAMIA
jgi:hypothetical protein